MARLTPSGGTSAPLGKAFKSHGFHDACDFLVIYRAEVRIVVEACSDAFSTIKPVLIIEDGLDFCTNCQMRVFGTGVLGTRYCRVPGSWYRAEGYVGPGR